MEAVQITEKTSSRRLVTWLALPMAPTPLGSTQPTIIWSAFPTSIWSRSSIKIGQVSRRTLFSCFFSGTALVLVMGHPPFL